VLEHGNGISGLTGEMAFGLADHARRVRLLVGTPLLEIFEDLGVEWVAFL
jgi:hypothetical protein